MAESTIKKQLVVNHISEHLTSNSSGVIVSSIPKTKPFLSGRFGSYYIIPFARFTGVYWEFLIGDLDTNNRFIASPNVTQTLEADYLE